MASKCSICNRPALPLFQETVLGNYVVQYFHCPSCDSIFTEKPYWLHEAYEKAISDLDTGLLLRNLMFSAHLEPIFHYVLEPNEPVLDISGGYGVFARLMRDRGFNFHSTDPYCENLFASYFQPDENFTCSVLTLFEVMEHLETPLEFLEAELARYHADTLIFSTTTFQGDPPDKSWWYYMFESGQHIYFYSPETLERIADRLNMTCFSLGKSLWMFTRKPLPSVIQKWRSSEKSRMKIQRKVTKEREGLSLTTADHLHIKRILNSSGSSNSANPECGSSERNARVEHSL